MKVKKVLKIFFLILMLTFMFGVGFGGYSIFNRYIQIAPGVQNNMNVTPEEIKPIEQIKGIDLEKSIFTTDNITEYTNYLEDFKNTLANESIYLQAIQKDDSSAERKYLDTFSKFLDSSYLKTLEQKESDNVIINMLKDIHREEYRHVYSITLVSIGKAIINDKEDNTILIDINSVGDKIGFRVQRLRLLLDDNKKIISIEKIGELHEQANTTTPLSNESGITNSINKEFLSEFGSVLKKLSNKNLYDKVEKGELTDTSSEWKSYVDSFNIKDKDTKALFELFSIGKGQFLSSGFISFENSDIDAEPVTTYTLKVADDKTTKTFNITFKRTTNKILKISKME